MNGYRILPKEHFGQSRIFKEDFNYHKSRYQFFKPLTESDADVLLMNMGTANLLKFIFCFLMEKRGKRSLMVSASKCHWRLHEWKFIWNDIVSNDVQTNFKEAITRLMENAQSGKYTYRWFQERIFISKRQWNRIVKYIRDEHSLFCQKNDGDRCGQC